MCYHTTFTCSAGFIRQAFELAAAEGVSVHMHASEGTYEPEHALEHFGGRTFEYYDRLGVAGPAMQASQCVQITPAEIEIIARRGVTGHAHAALQLRGRRRHRAGARPGRRRRDGRIWAATATSPTCSR